MNQKISSTESTPKSGVLFSNTKSQNIILDGSKVFVRVLSKNQNNTFTVSFAGNKFDVYSDKPLLPGTEFHAKISTKNGAIILNPVKETIDSETSNLIKINSSIPSTNIEITNWFLQMGLPADSVALKIVQFFQQMGIKPDLKVLSKAWRLAQKFPQKEKKAAEIAMFLEEKGIYADENNIKYLLELLEGNSNDNYNQDKNNALLQYINHKTENNKFWIVLPFEYTINETEKLKATGSIRILCNKDKKSTEIIKIYSDLSRKKYYFVLYFTKLNKKSVLLHFCQEPQLPILEQKKQITTLTEILNKHFLADVSYNGNLAGEGIFTSDTEVMFISSEIL